MDKKKLIIIGSSLIGAIVAILLIVWAVSLFAKHYKTYEEAEEYITDAAKSYYNNNPTMLPTVDGEYTVNYQTLVDAGYAKPLSEVLEDAASCGVTINVIRQNEMFSYITYLNCSDKYVTKELYKQILENNPVVMEDKGLYQSADGTYYFAGKVDNNYVKFGTAGKKKENHDILWRIISIKDNVIKLRSTESLEKEYKWDNKYNDIVKARDGSNDFDTSLFSEKLTNLVNEEYYLTDKEYALMTATNLCVGARDITDETKDGSVECAKLSKNKFFFGTLLPYEFLRASLDPNCTNAKDRSCTNFNYLYESSHKAEWTTTPALSNSSKVLIFNGSVFSEFVSNNAMNVYPVITLSKYAFYKEGTGTKADPYVIRY